MGDGMNQLPPDPTLEGIPAWRWMARGKRLLKLSGIILLSLAAILLVTLLYLKSRPLPPPDIPMTTKVYDIRGNLIDQMDRGEHRDPVQLRDVPRHLILATLAAEDRTFYDHFGLSLRGIARAALVNLREMRIAQGASTITQQLARNLYLTSDRTWSRKWKEAVLAVQLELHFSKDKILEMYLNEVYYGNGAYGIQRAAQTYFGKPAKQLTLAESAFLAGLPRGPKWYSPYTSMERVKRRQHAILDTMVRSGWITPSQAARAKAQHIALAPKPKPSPSRAPYFRDYIIQTAINRYGLKESELRGGGLRIYTTLDMDMQREAEEAVKRYLGNREGLQGALLAIDPKNGHIRAMVGGKDYRTSQYNRVFARRQPGSSFKPILYLAALEKGFTPVTKLESKPTAFPYEGGTYRPANFRNRYAGRPITLREAIARSDNVYAVQTHFLIGRDRLVEMARRLGFTSPFKPVPSLALGSIPVSPYEMTRAYAALASGGVLTEPVGILRIEDAEGKTIAESRPEQRRVASEAETFVLTHLLRSVFESGGTGHRVKQIFPYPSAGKTGSTDWDGWLAGYTPDLAATVWVGYDRAKKLPHEEGRLAQMIWGTFMQKSHSGKSARTFTVPDGVKGVYVDPDTGHLATKRCPKVRWEYFIAGTEPKESCPVHPSPETEEKGGGSLWDWIRKWIPGL
ncbi:1A family penicillin-binding protein [Planifilum fimeticola]|uniref:1A family penicillin-binding protein n=1 Tax=Planifilum fimeticola TaxID=201975 RepID=A0A2T0LI50_9BACL|nr:PBP1A family penicillin-binding protein [Planifilum fimeticola]PRX42094.1 1A family penicillin-binding protein [Planifilum fimeticola]